MNICRKIKLDLLYWRKLQSVIEKMTLFNTLFNLAQTGSQKGTLFDQHKSKCHIIYISPLLVQKPCWPVFILCSGWDCIFRISRYNANHAILHVYNTVQFSKCKAEDQSLIPYEISAILNSQGMNCWLIKLPVPLFPSNSFSLLNLLLLICYELGNQKAKLNNSFGKVRANWF